ncbi:hypothetical protein BDW68DRAFT_15207 [Aspergillus falconensis]
MPLYPGTLTTPLHRLTAANRLTKVYPTSRLEKEIKYIKQPLICAHYLIEWRVTLNASIGPPAHRAQSRSKTKRVRGGQPKRQA